METFFPLLATGRSSRHNSEGIEVGRKPSSINFIYFGGTSALTAVFSNSMELSH
jgi:hypothetical protein